MHIDIPPGAVPETAQTDTWSEVSERVRRALKGGGRVVVLCGDGGARSATVALRLMIETGAAPDDTKDRLVAAQSAGVGNARQMDWARRAEQNMPLFMRHSEE